MAFILLQILYLYILNKVCHYIMNIFPKSSWCRVTGFLIIEFRKISNMRVLSIIRTASSKAVSALGVHQITGYKVYCRYMDTQFLLWFDHCRMLKMKWYAQGIWDRIGYDLTTAPQIHKTLAWAIKMLYLLKEPLLYLSLHCKQAKTVQNVCNT